MPIGTYEGKIYLSAKTLELMTTDHAGKGPALSRDFFHFPGDGFGLGLGLAVRTNPCNAMPPGVGRVRWDGASAPLHVIDKRETFFEQTPSESQRIKPSLKLLVYETMAN